jgi:diguanylate cyclase (GGDEF)-like protein
MGIARAVLLAGLRTAASTDGLTQLANRRAFDETLQRELAIATGSGGSVALLLFDLDHFKRLNDELGHLGGDDVLRAVAAVLRQHARQGDTAARYGGEELALVLPAADLPAAVAAAERVRATIAEITSPARVTASIGVAVYPDCAAGVPELIAAADHALYAAKHGGRNQVQAAPLRQPYIPAQHRPGQVEPALR